MKRQGICEGEEEKCGFLKKISANISADITINTPNLIGSPAPPSDTAAVKKNNKKESLQTDDFLKLTHC